MIPYLLDWQFFPSYMFNTVYYLYSPGKTILFAQLIWKYLSQSTKDKFIRLAKSRTERYYCDVLQQVAHATRWYVPIQSSTHLSSSIEQSINSTDWWNSILVGRTNELFLWLCS